MSNFSKSNAPQQILAMWIIWFSIPAGLFIINRFVVGERTVDETAIVQGISLFGVIGIAMVVAAAGIRWLVIPKIQDAQAGLVAMVGGLALSEVPGFISMFLVPAEHVTERTLLYALSYASAVTFAPFYARRMCSKPDAPSTP